MIQNIPINEIAPHPHNLRKDLGDLTELSNSIKAAGILQNLTVIPCSEIESVPDEDFKYYALIGNRRLSAAKLAGVSEVPCAVVEMNESEQVATMLLENIQRSDLTAYEQAEGMQIMLNLGEDMNTIAKKTGFSETTIRRRVKLLDLDPSKFIEAQNRGATLADYAELEKIEDIERKNKVLETIGTSDFKWQLNKAIQVEERIRKKQEILKLVESYALRVDTKEGYSANILSIHDEESFQVPMDVGNIEYFYFIDDEENIYLLTNAIDTELEEEKTKKEQQEKLKLKLEKLKQATKLAYEMRFNFIKNWNSKKPEHKGIIISTAIEVILSRPYSSVDFRALGKLLDVDFYSENEHNCKEERSFEHPAIKKAFETNRYHTLLMVYYCLEMDSPSWNYYSTSNAKYEGNEFLDQTYNILQALGYELSSEEKKLKEGTHELYIEN